MKLFTKAIITGFTILDMALFPFSCSGKRHRKIWTEDVDTNTTVDTNTYTYVDGIWVVKTADINSYTHMSFKIINDGDLIIEDPNLEEQDSFFKRYNVEYWYLKNTDGTEKKIEFPYTVIEEDYFSEFETARHGTYYNCIVIYAGGEITKNV